MAKKCPICGSPMHKSGQLKPYNPVGRNRTSDVYLCPKCGHRSM